MKIHISARHAACAIIAATPCLALEPARDATFTIEPVAIETPMADFYQENPDYEVRTPGGGTSILQMRRLEDRWLLVTGDGFRFSDGESIATWQHHPMPNGLRAMDLLKAGDTWLMRISSPPAFKNTFATSRDLRAWEHFEIDGHNSSEELFVWNDAFYLAQGGRLRRSTDGRNWRIHLPAPYMEAWSQGWSSHVKFKPVGRHLFATGLSSVWMSEDGLSWGEIFADPMFRWALNHPPTVLHSGNHLVIERELQVTGSKPRKTLRLVKTGNAEWTQEEFPHTAASPTVAWPPGGFIRTRNTNANGETEHGLFFSADYSNWSALFRAMGVNFAPHLAASDNAVLADIGGYLVLHHLKDALRRAAPADGLPVAVEYQRIPPVSISDAPVLVRQMRQLQEAADAGDVPSLEAVIGTFEKGNNAVRPNRPLALEYTRKLRGIEPARVDPIEFAKQLAAFAPETTGELRDVLHEARAANVPGSWALLANYTLATHHLGKPDLEIGRAILLEGVGKADPASLLEHARLLIGGLYGFDKDLDLAASHLDKLEAIGHAPREVEQHRRNLQEQRQP